MQLLIRLSSIIDNVTNRIGPWFYSLIFLSVLISAFNAIVRKVFRFSSNGLLEIQWYLFASAFLLGAGYALLHDEHVRVDVLTSHLSEKARAWIDIFGTLFILGPLVVLICWVSWPFFYTSFITDEVSSEPGGLILWPARLAIPLGFLLLGIQAISEIIRRVGFITGHLPTYRFTGVDAAADEEEKETVVSPTQQPSDSEHS